MVDAAQLIMNSTNPRDVAYMFRDYARAIHKKSNPADPNFIRISVACAKVCLFSLFSSLFSCSCSLPSCVFSRRCDFGSLCFLERSLLFEPFPCPPPCSMFLYRLFPPRPLHRAPPITPLHASSRSPPLRTLPYPPFPTTKQHITTINNTAPPKNSTSSLSTPAFAFAFAPAPPAFPFAPTPFPFTEERSLASCRSRSWANFAIRVRASEGSRVCEEEEELPEGSEERWTNDGNWCSAHCSIWGG